MAIEDAWVLAQSLRGANSISNELAAYATARGARAAKVQMTARANAGLFHHRTLAARLKAYGPQWLAAKTNPSQFYAHQDWLYGHDVALAS